MKLTFYCLLLNLIAMPLLSMEAKIQELIQAEQQRARRLLELNNAFLSHDDEKIQTSYLAYLDFENNAPSASVLMPLLRQLKEPANPATNKTIVQSHPTNSSAELSAVLAQLRSSESSSSEQLKICMPDASTAISQNARTVISQDE